MLLYDVRSNTTMGRGSGYSQRFPGETPAPAGATAGGATPKWVTVRCWNIEHDDDLADYVMVVVAAGGVVLDWGRIDPDEAHEQAQIEVLIPDADVEAFEARLQAAC
ncbi:MAG: hypothetical protein ACUVX1_16170 [Chloroflexota bacterium]